MRGRDALVAFVSAPTAAASGQQRHLLTNLLIEPGIGAGTRQVAAYLAVYVTPPGGKTSPRLTALGTAAFTVAVVEDSWLISRLRIAFDSSPLAP